MVSHDEPGNERESPAPIETAMVSLWTSKPWSCTILFMGVRFPFKGLIPPRSAPLSLRFGRPLPPTRSLPKENTRLTASVSHNV